MFLRFKKFIFSIIHIYLELTTESKYLFERSFAHFHNQKKCPETITGLFFTFRRSKYDELTELF